MGDKERDVPLYQTFVRRVKPDVRTLGIFGGQHTTKTVASAYPGVPVDAG